VRNLEKRSKVVHRNELFISCIRAPGGSFSGLCPLLPNLKSVEQRDSRSLLMRAHHLQSSRGREKGTRTYRVMTIGTGPGPGGACKRFKAHTWEAACRVKCRNLMVGLGKPKLYQA
jgi:hypothetical protein